MKRTSSMKYIFLVAILISALPACSTVNEPVVTPAPATATATITETPTQTLEPILTATPTITLTPRPTLPPFPDLPTPRSGAGSLVGRVFWNDLPSKDVIVKLCEKQNFFTQCGGRQYTTSSNTDGIYIFDNVTAGSYAIIFKVIGATQWLVITGANPFEGTLHKVSAGKILQMKDTVVFKNDLVLSEPANAAVLKTDSPLFAWKAYPSAASYEVNVYSSNGTNTQNLGRTTDTSISLPDPLWVCSYTWEVKAYNAADTLLAEREGKFSVRGEGLTCKITITEPVKGAYLASEPFTVTWDPHPEATGYSIHLTGVGVSKRHQGSSSEPTYFVYESLPKGEYALRVCALGLLFKNIACSDDFRIHIR
jgi:hypothetical protein